ncbi:hypothetical protein BDW75DRAFT_235178 [Aspergillus navahoensis]
MPLGRLWGGPEIQKAVGIDPYISGKVPAEQFNKLLLQPLLNVNLHRIVTLVVVIDALDECQPTSDSDDHDIEVLLRLIRHNHGLPAEWPGKEAINELLTRTVPLFISAATLTAFEDILNDKSSYVSEMARTYLLVMNQLLVGQNEWEAPRLAQRFREIVGSIIVLATPLLVNGLSQLLGTTSSITLNNIKSLLNWLHSVLIITDDPEVPIRLQHLSFRDFLVDSTTRDIKESAKF